MSFLRRGYVIDLLPDKVDKLQSKTISLEDGEYSLNSVYSISDHDTEKGV